MTDFDQVLADCLDELASGASSLDECLARYPEHAAQLRPLLQTAARFERGRSLKPSAAFRARGRAKLAKHMKDHPRPKQSNSIVWRFTFSLAALTLAFLVSGTAFAQKALPGDSMYPWKRSSEKVWRAVTLDPLGTDLILSQRRAFELSKVFQDPDKSTRAIEDYEQTLHSLRSRQDADSHSRIYPVLVGQQELLKSLGVSDPVLDELLSGINIPPPEQELAPPLPRGESGSATPTVGPLPTPTPRRGAPTSTADTLPPVSVPTLPLSTLIP